MTPQANALAQSRNALMAPEAKAVERRRHVAHDGMIERFVTVDGVIPVETAKMMIQMARRDVQDPNVASAARWIVRDLVDENLSPFAAVMSEIQALYNWIAQVLRYTRDPIGVELVFSPTRVLDFIGKYGRWSEDCDSQSLLVLTFFMAIGRKSRLTIAGFKQPGIYTHVFAEVWVPGFKGDVPARWLIVDPSTAQHVGRMAQGITTALHFYPDGKVETYNA